MSNRTNSDPAVLIENLQKHTLDPRFERYGNFILFAKDGGLTFWGNFIDYSAVFHIVTNDTETCKNLIGLIRQNQQSPAYLEAQQAYRVERATSHPNQHPNGYIESSEGPYAAY